MTEIYITCLLQILTFSSRFKECEMKNFLRRPTMVANNISLLVAPRIFFTSTGLFYTVFQCLCFLPVFPFFWKYFFFFGCSVLSFKSFNMFAFIFRKQFIITFFLGLQYCSSIMFVYNT